MTDKFVMLSLDDKKAKIIADALGNATARKILDYLSEKEASASEVSKELGLALSTTEYNLNNLVNAGLLEVKEFKWSPKGRQVDIYKIKRKYIIIAPSKSNNVKEALRRILPVGGIGLIISGLIEYYTEDRTIKVPFITETVTKTVSKVGPESAGSAMMQDAIAEASRNAPSASPDIVANITTQVTEKFTDVALPNPHYGYWFFFGLIVALLLYFVFNWRFRK